MNDATILTHAAFDRPPVLNAVRRGPTPRSIPMIHRERQERRSEYGLLRRWAREHGIEPVGVYESDKSPRYDYDKLRELKARHETNDELTEYKARIANYKKLLDEIARHLLRAAEAIADAREID